MATVVRTFAKGAEQTARGKGRMRANYGAAMKQKTAGLDRATQNYTAGIISAREMAVLQQIYVEQALGTLAGGINSVTEGLNFLVPLNDKSIGVLKLLSGSMMTVRGVLAIHRMWTSYIEMQRRRQVAMAAGETTVAAIGQQWHAIALAGVAAGAVAAAFGGGWMAGRAISGGTVDLSDAGSRRRATVIVSGAV